MARLTPATSFDLVHVGKCAGSTLVVDLRAQAVAGHRYVVLVRDPVARFVSAFNWCCHDAWNGSASPSSGM